MKRILSLVVCICMVVSLLPANVMAAPLSGGEHVHCDCVYALSGKDADKCTAHNDAQSWQEWNDSTKLPTTTGYYYLSVDVTLTAQMEIGKSAAANVHICTNGHDITSTVAAAATFGILRVYKGSNLTITNCQAMVADGLLDTTDPNKTSTLSGAVTTATSGGMIQAYQGVDLNIWGVEFKNNETRGNHDSWSGGAILAVGNDGTANVQNINIAYAAFTGNHATQKGGGALGLLGGTVTIRNTVFTENTAKHNGGAISVNGGVSLTLSDCKFVGNTAENRGGAVSMNSGNPQLTVTNCIFLQNKTTTTAAQGGGVLYVNSGTANLTGCTLQQNENKGYHGSAITQAAGNLSLEGCTVTGNTNTARDNRAGIVVIGGAASTTVSGRTVISGNTNQNVESNLLLRENGGKQPKLTVGAVTEGTNITLKTLSAIATPASFLAAGTNCPVMTDVHGWLRYENYLNSSNEEELFKSCIHYNGTAFAFGAIADHGHADCACAIAGASCGDHTSAAATPVYWQKWVSTTTLPTTAGHYYLTGNVTLTQQQVITGQVYICTGGFDITSTVAAAETYGVLRVQQGAGLHVINCKAVIKDDMLDTADPAKTSTLSGAVTTASSGALIQAYKGADVSLFGVEIKNNETRSTHDTWSAGAILAVGNNGTDVQNIHIAYSVFAGNHATQKGGGALGLLGGSATIRNTLFRENTAKHNGGAISINGGATVQLTDCKFLGNTAENRGGAVSVNSGNPHVTATGCTFTENKATDAAAQGGGALYINSGETSLVTVTMTGNKNSGYLGSAITQNAGTLSLEDCTVAGNTNAQRDNRAGIVVVGGASGTVVSGKTVISGNTNQGVESNLLLRENAGYQPKLTVGALEDGTGITVKTVSDISDPNDFLTVGTGCPNMTDEMGWIRYENRMNASNAAHRLTAVVRFDGTEFSFGTVEEHKHHACVCAISGVSCDGHTEQEADWQMWVDADKLPTDPGHYYLTCDVILDAPVNISKQVYICTNGFDIRQGSDTAAAQFGLIRSSGAGLTIVNCKAQVKDGRLDTSDPAKTSTLSGGKTTATSAGMLHVNAGSDLALYGVAFTDNQSSSDNDKGWSAGAVLCIGDNGDDVQNVKIAYCDFTDNKATQATGGALSLRGGVAEIRNTTFKNNYAATNGGAISVLNVSTKLTVDNCDFVENGIKGKNTVTENGGAIYAITGDIAVTDSLFSGNGATASGGAVCLRASGSVNATFTDTAFCKNTSGTEGAALYISGSTATVTDCTVSENTSATGGVIYLRAGGKLTVNKSSITKNRNNGTNGSAITANDGTTLTLNGTKILSNTNKEKDFRGGVVIVDNAKFTVSGETIIDGNMNGGKECNLFLRAWQGQPKMTVGQLTGKAYIGMTTTDLQADPDNFLTKGVSGAWNPQWDNSWLFYDNTGVAVAYNEKELFYFAAAQAHKDHCLCAGTGGGCDHSAITWIPWGKTNSLPTSGNYYLTVDVELAKGVDLNNTKLQLCLNGHTVKQTGKTHIFNIVGEEAELVIADCSARTVDGVYLAGTLTGGQNGAILVRPNTLKLYDGIITGNTRQYAGGAVNMLGEGTFYMHGGLITGNKSGSHGGGVMVDAGSAMKMTGGTIKDNTSDTYGGGIYVRNSTLELTGGIISGNKAPEGGGIYGTDSAKLTLNGAQIRGNEARIGGGMILFRQTHLEYKAGWVYENKTTSDGSGIYVANDASMTMSGGTIYDNEGAGGVGLALYKGTVTMNGGTISTNKAVGNGGGILAKAQSSLTLNGGNIQFNYAKRNGGGIFATEESSVILDGAVIRRNTTGKDGGGAGLFITQKSSFTMKDGKVEENVTAYDGGGMYIVNDSEFTMTGGSVTGNKAVSGAGIGVFKSDAVIKGGKIQNNVAQNNAGGLYVQTESTLRFQGGTVKGNKAGASGAGMYAFRDTKLVISGGSITENIATSDGGGLVANTNCTVVIQDGVISKNVAQEHSAGGVLILTDSKFTMTGGLISGNTAKVDGGNVYLYRRCTMKMTGGTIQGGNGQCGGGLRLHSTEATLSGGTIQKNTAGVYGGGIHMSDLSKVTLSGTALQLNDTPGSGGGLYVSGTGNEVTVDGSVISGNTAKNLGGGLAVQSYTAFTMKTGKIINNKTEDRGGGLYVNRGHVVINGGLFEGNHAPSGGAIYAQGDVMAKEGTFLMNGGTITGNTADIGGGIGIYRLRVTLEGGTIQKNTAKQGGGVHSTNTSVVGIGKVEITGNNAEDGAGLYLTRGTRTEMTGTHVAENVATGNGGGIWADGRLEMTDLTVTGNKAKQGGGIYLEKAGYDGESYVSSVFKIGGKMLVAENKDTDLFISEGTLVNVSSKGLSDGTNIGVTLQSGTLTRTVIGAYDYEGGNLNYVITAGDRSLTDPEPVPQTENPEDVTSLIWIPVAVVLVILVAGGVILLLTKKKKGQK